MVSVNLSDDLVTRAKHHGEIRSRSTPKQIEYWAKIGQFVEENPYLPAAFIQDVMHAMADPSPRTPFEFTEIDPPEFLNADR